VESTVVPWETHCTVLRCLLALKRSEMEFEGVSCNTLSKKSGAFVVGVFCVLVKLLCRYEEIVMTSVHGRLFPALFKYEAIGTNIAPTFVENCRSSSMPIIETVFT